MSVESISLVLNHSKAKGTDKVVLIGIANHDGDGGSWPSLATLARYANVDERTVRRTLSNLVASGELVVEHNAGGKRGTRTDRRPNLYRITITPPQEEPVQGPVDIHEHGRTPTSPRDAAREDAHVTDGRTPTSPEPSFNQENPPTPRTAGGHDPYGPKRCTVHRRRRRNCADCQLPPKPAPPPWCGQCDPQGAIDIGARIVDVIQDGRHYAGKCPRCHPGHPNFAGAA